MKTLSFVTTRGFEAGHENCGQFRRFFGEFAKLLNGQILSFGRKAKPELSLIRLLKSDLKFGAKLCFGPGYLRSAIISGGTRPTSGQLMRDRSGACTTGQRVRRLEAAKCETPGAAHHVDHLSFYTFSSLDQTSIQLQ